MIQWAEWLELHILKSPVCIVKRPTEVDEVHVELILGFVDEQGVVHVSQVRVTVWDVDENVSMDWADSHVVDKGYALWSTERVILVDLKGQDVELCLVNGHKVVVDSHRFLLQKLQLAHVHLFPLEFCKVDELVQIPNLDVVRVELDQKAGAGEKSDECEDCEAKAEVIVPVDSQGWIRTVILFHSVSNLDCDQADERQDCGPDQMSDDDAFDPDLKLCLTLDVEARIEILAKLARLLRLITTVKVPFHPNQVPLWTLQLIDICGG